MDSLNPCFNGRYSQSLCEVAMQQDHLVLILVLMEDTLRDGYSLLLENAQVCLHPCFNGRYSQRDSIKEEIEKGKSLNPCFNGRYSQSEQFFSYRLHLQVLILVLMEDTLRENKNLNLRSSKRS